MICETMYELNEWYFVIKISYLKCYNEVWLNILILWCIILIDFDTTWLYILLSKLEYETWFMKNYDIRHNKNWQPDYVKDPANGGMYVGNWLSWGFMSPARPATCRQRDQRQTASKTSGSKGLYCEMICNSPQEDTRCYDPTTEKIWS